MLYHVIEHVYIEGLRMSSTEDRMDTPDGT